ncbi:MAG: gluconokinase [Cyanobacteria bacterium P01_C01_bin.120]
MIIIIMGVSGIGKSTVGQMLADALSWRFVEGDAWHSSANIQKMSRGVPLTDDDRLPWLQHLRTHIRQLMQQQQSAVVTCSALKQSYREILHPHPDEAIQFVYLKGSKAIVRSRLSQRQKHFMKAEMLESQLAALEEPHNAIVIDVEMFHSLEQIITQIRSRLGR